MTTTFTALERSRLSRVGVSEVCAACPGCNQELKMSSTIAGILTNIGALFLLIMRNFTPLQQFITGRRGFLVKQSTKLRKLILKIPKDPRTVHKGCGGTNP